MASTFDFAGQKVHFPENHTFDYRLVCAHITADLDPLAGRTANVEAVRSAVVAEFEIDMENCPHWPTPQRPCWVVPRGTTGLRRSS
jgi:hypothetical protein